MTTPRQQTELQALIKNMQLIDVKMCELTEIFEKNEEMITTLINGFSLEIAAEANGTSLTPTEQAITNAVATLNAQDVHIIPRQWLAIVARISPKSSLYRTALASLLKRRMLVRAGDGLVKAASWPPPADWVTAANAGPLNWGELLHRFAGFVSPKEAEIMHELLLFAYNGSELLWLDRKTLAEKLGQSAESSSFRQRLTQLEKDGFIVYGPFNSTVRANIGWFRSGEIEGKGSQNVAEEGKQVAVVTN